MPSGVYERKPLINMGEKSSQWKGDNVGYFALHKWLYRRVGKASDRQCSRQDLTCRGKLEWANVSGEYKRDTEDFMVLCSSHHTRYDKGGR